MRFPLFMALAFCAYSQDAPLPAFDAAFVKANTSGSNSSHSNTRPANVQMTNVTLRSIITMAYRLKDYQVEGPEWMRSARFDVVAKAPVGTPESQLPAMMRTLLAERFNLQTHKETQDFPVYGLFAAKGGFKLTPVEPGGSGTDSNTDKRGGELKATKTSMEHFAQWVSGQMDRPVIDMTGIQGVYDFTLKYSRENSGDNPEVVKYPVLPLALQEQLGLRLERKVAPIEVLVVDRIEKTPIEN